MGESTAQTVHPAAATRHYVRVSESQYLGRYDLRSELAPVPFAFAYGFETYTQAVELVEEWVGRGYGQARVRSI